MATTFDAAVIERVVTVLVIACPHALGLAIPLVVAINTSLAARNGMLVKDRIAMEQARELNVIVFDKTGTLTEGEQGVVDIATVDGVSEEDALELAATVEGDSEHMIAEAIREAANERGVSRRNATGFEALKGRGVRAMIDGQTVHVGGPNLLTTIESKVGLPFWNGRLDGWRPRLDMDAHLANYSNRHSACVRLLAHHSP